MSSSAIDTIFQCIILLNPNKCARWTWYWYSSTYWTIVSSRADVLVRFCAGVVAIVATVAVTCESGLQVKQCDKECQME